MDGFNFKDGTSPLTDALIAKVMRQHLVDTPRALAKYYEAVHQELAPFCRELEIENRALRELAAMPTLKPGVKP